MLTICFTNRHCGLSNIVRPRPDDLVSVHARRLRVRCLAYVVRTIKETRVNFGESCIRWNSHWDESQGGDPAGTDLEVVEFLAVTGFNNAVTLQAVWVNLPAAEL